MAEFLSALPASLSAIPNRDIGQAPALRWHASATMLQMGLNASAWRQWRPH